MEKIAFLFPGQGAQYRGMFKTHWVRYPQVRQTFEEASDTLGFDLFSLCSESTEEELTLPQNTQPALLAAGVAAYRAWTRETGVVPFALAGHSLGEYTALVCSGAIPFNEALAIVRQRGWLMKEAASAGKGGMLAVNGITGPEAEALLSELPEFAGQLVVACYNSARQQVLSGPEAALIEAERRLSARGARTIPLKVGAAFHGPSMADAASELETFLRERSASIGAPRQPVVSNATALPYEGGAESIIQGLVREMTEPVLWKQTMAYLRNQAMEAAIDFGPQRTMKHLLLQDDPAAVVYAFDFPEDHEKLFSPEWKARRRNRSNRRLLEACLVAAVATPNRNEDRLAYTEGAVKPYREIEEMLLEAERRGSEPTDEDVRAGLERLTTILRTKGASEQEQLERTNAIAFEIHRKAGSL